MYAAVILQNGKKVVIPSEWVKSRRPNRETLVFLSKNKKKKPDFSLNTRYFSTDEDTCHNGIYLNSYGKSNLEVKKPNLNLIVEEIFVNN